MELTVNIPTLLVQVANFIILWVVLDMVLYKPMVGAITERQSRITKAINEAEAINNEALTLKEQYEARMRDARQEAAAIVQAATQEGERVKSQLTAEGHQEKQRIIDKGQQEVQRERQQALSELRGRVVDLSVDMAGQLFRQTLGPDQHRQLVEQFLKKADQIHVG